MAIGAKNIVNLMNCVFIYTPNLLLNINVNIDIINLN